MGKYIDRLWATRKQYIISLLVLVPFIVIAMVAGNAVNSVNLGIAVGCVSSFIIVFGPVIYVDSHHIKVKRPKPQFVEPKAWVIYSLAILQLPIVTLLYFLLIVSIFSPDYINFQLTHDTFMSGVLGGIGIVLVIGLVPSICMIYMKTHYKKIVEFKSLRWYKYHYPSKFIK